MPLSTSLYQEGIIIPPVKIVENGEIVPGVMTLLLNNVRTPVEREGDFAAQIMANITGVTRLKELIEKYGLQKVDFYAASLNDYAESITRNTIKSIPDVPTSSPTTWDGDGVDCENVPISVTMEVKGDSAKLDFTASGDQVTGSVNAVRSITLPQCFTCSVHSLKETCPPTPVSCVPSKC